MKKSFFKLKFTTIIQNVKKNKQKISKILNKIINFYYWCLVLDTEKATFTSV